MPSILLPKYWRAFSWDAPYTVTDAKVIATSYEMLISNTKLREGGVLTRKAAFGFMTKCYLATYVHSTVLKHCIKVIIL